MDVRIRVTHAPAIYSIGRPTLFRRTCAMRKDGYAPASSDSSHLAPWIFPMRRQGFTQVCPSGIRMGTLPEFCRSKQGERFVMIGVYEQQHVLACMEVWGGNRSVTRTVELPDLTVWVYSRPAGEQDRGGDVHYLSVCGQAVLSRVVLADVSGHGSEVSAPAQVLHALMREHINTWDQMDFVRGLNQSFRGCVAHR